ncbi:MAG: hypothetical protein R6V67_02835 [Spirochaetia bacterium]
MRDFFIRILTAVIITGTVFPAPPDEIFESSSVGGEPRRVLSFLSEEKRKLAPTGAEGKYLAEELRRKSREEFGSSDDQGSGLEKLSELYIRQYVEKEHLAEERFEMKEDLFGGNPAAQTENLMQSSYAEEKRLVEERLAWEKSLDEEYERRLDEKREEYENLQKERERWYGEVNRLIEEGDEIWLREIAKESRKWCEKEDTTAEWNMLHHEPFIASVEGNLDVKRESLEMIEKAELELYRGKDDEYWRGIKKEFEGYLEKSEQGFEVLIDDELGKIKTPGELAVSEAEAAEEEARSRLELLSRLIAAEEEEMGHVESRDELEELQFSLSSLRVDGPELEDVREEKRLAAELYEDAGRELTQLRRQYDGTLSSVPQDIVEAFRKEDEALEVLQSLRKGSNFLNAKIEKRKNEYEENGENYRSYLHDLLLLPGGVLENELVFPGENGLQLLVERKDRDRYRSEDEYFLGSAGIWLAELDKEREAGELNPLLRDFALAYGHETDDIDPGYASTNGAYQSLKEEIDEDGGDYLEERQKSGYNRVVSEERSKILYEFYKEYLQIRSEDAEGSLLWRASVEDLGEVLFTGIDNAAEDEYSLLKDEESVYNVRAATAAAAAVAMAATLNFPAAAVFTATAAAAKVSASRAKTEAEDIELLRNSLNRTDMSGSNERSAFSGILSDFSDTRDRTESLQEELLLLTGETRGAEVWMEDWEERKGAFDFRNPSFSWEAEGESSFDVQTLISGEIRAAEFLEAAEAEALKGAQDAGRKRIHTWNEHYAAADWAERSSMLQYALESTESGKNTVYANELFELRAAREQKVMEDTREVSIERLREERRFWERRSEEIFSRGDSFWEREVNGVEAAVEEWDYGFRSEYGIAEELWQGKLEKFQDLSERIHRESIVFEAEKASSLSLRKNDLDIKENMRRHLPSFSENRRVLDSPTDARTLLHAGSEDSENNLNEGFKGYNEKVSKAYSNYLDGLPQMYRRLSETKRRAELTLMVDGLEDLLRRETRDLESAIGRANESVSRGVETSFRSAGYYLEKGKYEREAVLDVSLHNYEMERQQVRDYTFYEEPDLLWERRLHSIRKENRSPSEAGEEYERTLDEITGRRALVFGNYKEDGSSLFSKVRGETASRFAEGRDNFKASANKELREKEGLFFFHVGYAPVMNEEDSSETKEEGYGELGRIYSEFYEQETSYRRGLAMLELPSWDRRLWDDDANNDGESDGWFSAPSTRGVVDLAVTAAATAFLSPGAGQVLANLGDDILFASAEVGEGRQTIGEAAFDIGKSAAVSSVSSASSYMWGGADAAVVAGGEKDLFENVFTAGGQSVTSTGARAGISSITYDAEEGFDYDLEGLQNRILSGSSLAAVSDGFLGTIGRNAFHNTFLQDAKSYGFSSADTLELGMVGELGIDLAKGAVHYGVDGEVSFNILGVDDIFGGLGTNTGLLQLNLSGGGSTDLSLGAGGIDLSPGRVVQATQGLETMAMQHRIASAVGEEGAEPLIESVMRFQHSFGDQEAEASLESILSGKDTFSLDDTADYFGLTRKNIYGGRDISIGYSGGVSLDIEQANMLALVLQHEAHRDGVGGLPGDGSGLTDELESAVTAHAQMAARIASDSRYSKDFIKQNPELFLDMAALGSGDPLYISKLAGVYDNSRDYWRLTEDGYMDWDGSHHLWGPDGRLMAVHDRGSFSRSLAHYLETSREEALDLMEKAGLRWSSEDGTYIQGESEHGIPAPYKLTANYEIMRKYGSFYQGEMDFTGIDESATLHRYSQQRLEEAVTGAPLNASEGNGYCLAESYAFAYVDSFPSVDWENITEVFKNADWGGHFNPDTGFVGDKTEFTRILSKELDISAAAVERRYSSVEDLQTALSGMKGESGKYPDYRVIADYGSHFTHVRPDGLEINTYSGWSSEGKEPEGWRLITWVD